MSTVFIQHNHIILFYDLPKEQSPQCFLHAVLAWLTSEQILSRLDMCVQLVAGSSTQVPGLWTSINVWEVKKYYTCILKGKKLCKTLSALKCGTATNECKKTKIYPAYFSSELWFTPEKSATRQRVFPHYLLIPSQWQNVHSILIFTSLIVNPTNIRVSYKGIQMLIKGLNI